MAHPPDNRPVVGLFEDGAGADKAAREIRARGLRAGVTSGTEAAEGRVGRHLRHGLVVGLLIALPFAIVMPVIVRLLWAWAGSPLLALPILSVGGALGLLIQAARRDGLSMPKRARAKLVVTQRVLDPAAADQAATIISESGGDLIQAPEPATHIAD